MDATPLGSSRTSMKNTVITFYGGRGEGGGAMTGMAGHFFKIIIKRSRSASIYRDEFNV